MNKLQTRTATKRPSRKYQYGDEGPYWLSIRLKVMTNTLKSRRGYTLSSNALREEGRPVVRAVREYLETQRAGLSQRMFRRLQNSLARYEAEAA